MDTIATAAAKPATTPRDAPEPDTRRQIDQIAIELSGLAEALDIIGHPEADEVLRDASMTTLLACLAGAARRLAYDLEKIASELGEPSA
jgi:G3E family GTPase